MQSIVTGSTGFIGKKLRNSGLIPLPAMFLSRIDFEKESAILAREISEQLDTSKPLRVINLMSYPGKQKGNSSSLETEKTSRANYILVKNLLESLVGKFPAIDILNFSSYFQFYYQSFNVDKNEYAYFRRKLSEKIAEYGRRGQLRNYLDIYLPHIYGREEYPHRLIPTIIRHIKSGEILQVSGGKQYLPILNLEDLIKNLHSIMRRDHSNQISMWIKPEIELTLIAMYEELKKYCNLKMEFNDELNRPNEFYSPIEIPGSVEIWKSRIGCNWREYILSESRGA